ncbi:MAG: redoxin domain-containing protein [Leptolyngbya sp. SIO4C5]|nr:redoxin domain-containing protein [Leptolyngbya sp. SIO4C5]
MARVRAPELPQQAPWLNSSPRSLRSLRGRVVLLDFWTYSCINCLHILDDLHYLASRYTDHLTIIGVHSAKFDHEQKPENVQQAIQRYGITHPVVIDVDGWLWDQYAVRAWPTFVLIDPAGYVIATRSGEGQRPALEALIQQMTAAPTHTPASPSGAAAQTVPDSLLAFPLAVLADESSDTLFIADTGHHRLLLTTLAVQIKAIVGSGIAGMQDGAWATAQWRSPQGMSLDSSGQQLYVADTGNHLVRRVDLSQQQVATVAGTGVQNACLFPHGGRALEVPLNSPWDLAQVGDRLYVSMTGAHQIWQIDLTRSISQTLIGTGAEFCVDGGVAEAAFAQPSGLTTNGQTLFVADSETSSIRAVTLTEPPTVRTLCGSGQLFGFGDRDGIGSTARLQHCLGVAADGEVLWIADTYNHKIKHLNPQTQACTTQWPQQAAQLAEPSGLALTTNHLYIADTNHHAIHQVDLTSGALTTLAIAAVCTPETPC